MYVAYTILNFAIKLLNVYAKLLVKLKMLNTKINNKALTFDKNEFYTAVHTFLSTVSLFVTSNA